MSTIHLTLSSLHLLHHAQDGAGLAAYAYSSSLQPLAFNQTANLTVNTNTLLTNQLVFSGVTFLMTGSVLLYSQLDPSGNPSTSATITVAALPNRTSLSCTATAVLLGDSVVCQIVPSTVSNAIYQNLPTVKSTLPVSVTPSLGTLSGVVPDFGTVFSFSFTAPTQLSSTGQVSISDGYSTATLLIFSTYEPGLSNYTCASTLVATNDRLLCTIVPIRQKNTRLCDAVSDENQ